MGTTSGFRFKRFFTSVFSLAILIVSLLMVTTACIREDDRDLESVPLRWWSPKRGDVKSMGELPVYRALQAETGIAVEFIHPQPGQHAEQFKAMISAEELPDIISHDFVNDYPGGIEKAVADGIIIPLNELIETHAPNLRRYLQEHSDIAEMLSTDDGMLFCFPSLQPDPAIRTYMGPFYRGDIFSDLGIGPPATMEQWTAVLEALHESPLVDIPLSFYGGNIRKTNAFIGAYGAGWGFYRDGREVKYGALEPGFTDFIMILADWYDRGYIDPGFGVNSLRVYRRQAKRKTVGIFIDYVSSMDLYAAELEKQCGACTFIPLPFPSAVEGEKAEFGHLAPVFVPFASAYVTSANDRLEETARLLDFAYSKEGNRLFNFGIQGESYEMVNGAPRFKAEMAQMPGGYSSNLKRFVQAGPYVKDSGQFFGSLILEQQREAVEVWGDTNAAGHELPPLYPPAELADEFDSIMRRIRPYEEEAVVRFITEGASLKDLEAFHTELIEMGIERAVEIMQISLEKRSR